MIPMLRNDTLFIWYMVYYVSYKEWQSHWIVKCKSWSENDAMVCEFLLERKCAYKTCLFKYTEHFTTKKWKISDTNSDIFFIFLLH